MNGEWSATLPATTPGWLVELLDCYPRVGVKRVDAQSVTLYVIGGHDMSECEVAFMYDPELRFVEVYDPNLVGWETSAQHVPDYVEGWAKRHARA